MIARKLAEIDTLCSLDSVAVRYYNQRMLHANLIKSHSFVVRKANGVDDFRIQLRASYWNKITSERSLRAALTKAFEQGIARGPQAAYYRALRTHYEAGDVLYVLRDFGMIAGSERLTKNQK
jgi:hypothetical protein